MSLRRSGSVSPNACSGDMYNGDPLITPSMETCTLAVRNSDSSTGLASPKSNSLATSNCPPRSAAKMFAGLMSRCTSPA